MTVDAGSYTVVETDADGYDTTYYNCTQVCVPTAAGNLQDHEQRETGTIEVEKDLEPSDDPGRFDLLVNGSDRGR